MLVWCWVPAGEIIPGSPAATGGTSLTRIYQWPQQGVENKIGPTRKVKMEALKNVILQITARAGQGYNKRWRRTSRLQIFIQ